MVASASRRKQAFLDKMRKADRHAYNCFCELVKQGCDPLSLLATITLLGNPEAHLLGNWQKDCARMNSEDLRQFAGQIRQMALKVRRFNRSRAAWTTLAAHSPQSPLLNLPAQLDQYAAMLESLTRFAGPKKHMAVNCYRGILVLDVRKATGNYHDKEVSRLIAYAEKNWKYSRRAHIRWRRDNL